MFTSEPSLAQRIERMIGDTPIIDARSNIQARQPNAPDLAALIGEAGVLTELIAVGMPEADFDLKLPADERVRRSIPYLARTRNTSTSWALFRIFRDLYDFADPILTESNYQELFDKVARTGLDPDWPQSVLRDRSQIQSVVTTQPNPTETLADESDLFYYRADVDDLFHPDSARNWERTLTGRVKLVTLSIAGGSPVDPVLKSALKWHNDHRRTLQIVPLEPFDSWASEIAPTLASYPDARFDLIVTPDRLGLDAALLARKLPNVSIAGLWSDPFLPSLIEKNVGLRLQTVPATKLGGFASNAPSVEWTYARLQVVRKAMGSALAGLVEARFFEEDEIPPLLRQIFFDTPRQLYGLGEG